MFFSFFFLVVFVFLRRPPDMVTISQIKACSSCQGKFEKGKEAKLVRNNVEFDLSESKWGQIGFFELARFYCAIPELISRM